jgi:hypothetical protein
MRGGRMSEGGECWNEEEGEGGCHGTPIKRSVV